MGSSTVGNVPYPVYMLYGMATCVAVSRVFDGAHYPHDVLVGGLLGRAIGLFHFTTVYPYVRNQMLDLSNFHCIGCGLAVAAGMLLSTLLCYRIVSARFGSPPKKWKLLAKVKNDDLQPHYVPLFDYVGMCGVFAGLSIAEPIYNRELLAVLPVTFVASVLRLLIGLTLLVGAWFAVRGIEKSMATSTWLKLLLRFCRYAQVPPISLDTKKKIKRNLQDKTTRTLRRSQARLNASRKAIGKRPIRSKTTIMNVARGEMSVF